MAGANVGPLAKISFAQDHGAGLAQLRGDVSVLRRVRSHERQRSRRGAHAVRGIDIVLDEDGNAMQRPARPFRPALDFERVGNLESIGVEFDDRVDHGAGFVDLLNACQVFLG